MFGSFFKRKPERYVDPWQEAGYNTAYPAMNNVLDRMLPYFNNAMDQGAYGGKVCGAGGRGFLLLICPKNIQRNIKKKLNKLQFLDFDFDYEGCKVIKLI